MQKIKNSIRILVAIGLIFLLVNKIEIQETIALFYALNWWWIGIALLTRIGSLLINTERWRVLLVCHNHVVDFWRLFQARLVGVLYNTVLPSSMGGEMMRALYLSKKENIIMPKSVSTVVIEKISGVGAMVIILLLAFIFHASIIADAGIVALVIMLSVSIGTLVVLLFNKQLYDFISLKTQHKKNKIAKFFLAYYQAVHHYHDYKKVISISVLYSLIIQAVSIFTTWAVAHSLGIPLGFADILLVVPLVGLSNVVPVSIGNWGWREGVYVFILQLFGIAPTMALALALAMRMIGLVMSVFGLIVILTKKVRTAKYI